MRRDQLLFLAGGVALGLIIGLIFGFVLARPDWLGVGSAPTPPAAAPAAEDPHAGAGMDAVSAQLNELRARIEKNPQDADALVSLGELLLQANMRERAMIPLQRAAQATNDAHLMMRIGAAFLAAGAPREALAAARRAMTLDKNLPGPAEVALRANLFGLGDVDAAEADLAEFRRRAPGNPLAETLAAEIVRIRGILEGAREKPGDYEAQVAAANLLFDAERWPEAEAAYRRALAVKGDDPNVITDLGITLFRQGRHADALRQFDRAFASHPNHWQAALNAAVVSLDAKDAKGAKTWIERLKALNPQSASIPQLEEQLAQLPQ